MPLHKHRVVLGFPLIAALLICPGCSKQSPASARNTRGGQEEGHDHSHERGQMLIADAGKYHALLTAHLSREGNELDLLFETQDEENPKPVAIPVEFVTGEARTADGEIKELKFEPAPAEERPKDEKPGTYSKFVAKAPWMKPADNLTVVARVKLDGKDVTIRWKDFVPQKYGHDADKE